jgi:hypothetical protein
MLSKIFGRIHMDLDELVRAILAGDLLQARQWVADARRGGIQWERVAPPRGLDERGMTVAAGITELLALRASSVPPAWTAAFGPLEHPVILDPGLDQMPRSFAFASKNAPEPLRKRNLVALPDFLAVA